MKAEMGKFGEKAELCFCLLLLLSEDLFTLSLAEVVPHTNLKPPFLIEAKPITSCFCIVRRNREDRDILETTESLFMCE